MKLSELPFGEVIRDGEFDNLAPINEKYEFYKNLSFINSEEYFNNKAKNISCLIITKDTYKKIPEKELENFGVLIAEKPKDTFFEIQDYLLNNTEFYGKRFKSIISKKAKISEKALISENNVIIEDDVIIGANTIIKANTIIGEGSYIGENSIIGAECFSYNNKDKVKSSRGTIIEKNVEILGNSVVESGIYRATKISTNTKVGYNSTIEHDTIIGENNIICSGTTITGRVIIGESCYFGTNSIIRNNLLIGNNARISMGAVVTKNVEANQTVTGNLAIEHSKFIENLKKIK